MKTKVFLSAGTPFNVNQGLILNQVKAVFEREGLLLCQPEFSPKVPLLNVRESLIECKGLLAIAAVRYSAKEVLEKPGSEGEALFSNVEFTTPWIHIETSLAYDLGLPIMLIADKNLRREGFLEHGYDWNIQYVDYNIDFFKSDSFISMVKEFDKLIAEYVNGKYKRFKSEEISGRLTVGNIFKDMSISAFVQISTVLAALLSAAFYLGKAFGKYFS
jgi:hypothetical protein